MIIPEPLPSARGAFAGTVQPGQFIETSDNEATAEFIRGDNGNEIKIQVTAIGETRVGNLLSMSSCAKQQ